MPGDLDLDGTTGDGTLDGALDLVSDGITGVGMQDSDSEIHTGTVVVSGVHLITILALVFMEETELHITEDIETEVIEMPMLATTATEAEVLITIDLEVLTTIGPEVVLITEAPQRTEEEYLQIIIEEPELLITPITDHIPDQDRARRVEAALGRTEGVQEVLLATEAILVLEAEVVEVPDLLEAVDQAVVVDHDLAVVEEEEAEEEEDKPPLIKRIYF